jgi:P-type E1-E2 ATPase
MYNIGMIELTVPGRGVLQLEHLVSDVNGTLAVDGKLIEGVAAAIKQLHDRLVVHLLTADTFGKQDWIDQQLGVKSVRIHPGNEAEQKADYVRNLGAEKVVAIGQGANDAGMLAAAGLGICVLSTEGCAVETLLAGDIVAKNILTALELLEKPLRIIATLRK